MLNRRHFLQATTATVALPPLLASHAQAATVPAAEAGWRQYDITTVVEVGERTPTTRLWLPVPARELAGYQQTLAARFEAPGASHAGWVRSPAGAEMLAVDWQGSGQPQRVEMTHRVALRDRSVDLGADARAGLVLPAAERRRWLQGSALKPLDGVVHETAQRIVREAGAQTDLEKGHAVYDWIVANCHREGAVRGCGTGDVRYVLTSGNLGGKCADLNGLFVALTRASGVPARDAYGVRVDDSARGFKSLGKSGDITRAQHCRAEFYANGYGWIPVDPADVRKVVLEEEKGGIPVGDPRVRAARALLFGAWEMNWLAYNHAEDVALAGSRPALSAGFLMYPNGQTAQGQLDSLDPDNFRYRISARRVQA
ncbi:MAG: hypothetical protein GAK30_00488 [Paracidovorax wautersii]|uniref:Transglutaminase-like domain-containing protein n=1 Tax=Paracidovorax wautersii TaxID=1177982 RepID=A0A7V8FRT2_9BURK|nr:MAG: hypothetical protein GAK30_00488 [Paracidovorax wautersii]